MLDQREVDSFRSLKRTAIVLLLLFRLDRPVGSNELAAILDIDRKTASGYLKSLAMRQLITRTHRYDGYILTQGGRQLILGSAPMIVRQDLPAEALQAQALGGEAPKALADGQAQFLDGGAAARGRNSPPPDPEGGEFPPREREIPLSALKESESVENIKFKESPTDSDSSETSGDKEHLDIHKILAATRLLFERSVFEFGLEAVLAETPAEVALGWVAQAYACRAQLRFPVGLIYKSLRGRRLPRAEYLDNPSYYLPGDYLAEIGLREAPPTVEEMAAEPGMDWVEYLMELYPASDWEQNPTGKKPEVAWQSALGQLQMEMPKATFETWVRGVKLITFCQGDFVFGVYNSYARDWLEGRLTSTLTRLLTGIMNRTVGVRFVCPEAI